MTDTQNELYIRTKERLRRLGKENPADCILALAEEVEYYRAKINRMDECIDRLRVDTVRKMQERLKAESFIVAPETNLGAVVLASDIDRVAEKILDGK